ncbi:hypothetical protein [Methylibium petroleiphilum]|uniref:hypothetical protein n=1 Tax=Methylibium petroleiphilum TaxID=105560 RepID=UPI00003CD133|nr:hypothetical protein [Methylibium petroleiphilum]
MKQAIGGAAAVIGIAWMLFVFSSPNPCDRIERGAAPVRITMDTARWAAKNWLSTEARIDMIRWSINADQATQRFIQHQFYGSEGRCVAPREVPAAAAAAETAASGAAQALPTPKLQSEPKESKRGS